MRGWRNVQSNATIHLTGDLDVATATDIVDVAEAGTTAAAKEAAIKQGVAENIATRTEIVPTPVKNARPELKAVWQQPPFLICKAAVLPIVNDGVGRD